MENNLLSAQNTSMMSFNDVFWVGVWRREDVGPNDSHSLMCFVTPPRRPFVDCHHVICGRGMLIMIQLRYVVIRR